MEIISDTDASWSTSKYRGWVYGYALHLTTTTKGLPRLARVHTACVSEKAGLDEKTDALLSKNIKYIVADAGYTDFARIQALAKHGLFLITPITNAKAAQKVAYLQTLQIVVWKSIRNRFQIIEGCACGVLTMCYPDRRYYITCGSL